MFRIILVTGMLLLGSNAWSGAYFVCTGADGKKTFQDKPCPGQGVDMPKSVDEQQQVLAEKKEYQSKPVKKNQWVFNQTSDDMTDTQSCGMRLGPIRIGYVNGKFTSVNLIIVNTGDMMALAVHTTSDHPLFHNDISGLGMKIGEYEFSPFSMKYGQSSIGFLPQETNQIVEELKNSAALRLRLRYWPYDTRYDSDPYSYIGFQAAYEKLLECQG